MRFFYFASFILCLYTGAFGQQQPAVCGTSDDNLPQSIRDRIARLPEILQNQRARTKTGEMRICRLGIEIDNQTYAYFDGDTNLIARKVYEDIARVSEVYEKEINTRIVVAGIRFWKDPATDPFEVTDYSFRLLEILAGLPAPDFETDKRMYLPTKQLSGSGGVAYLGGNFNVSGFGIPELIMHEVGHNFGSPHTHSCFWPGGPIDFCAPIEGGCYTGAQGSLARLEGTIMSYCRAEVTFHPLCQALMKDYAEKSLQMIDAVPTVPSLSSRDHFISGDFYTWDVVPSALTYEVLIAASPDFSDSRTVTTGFNGISLEDIQSGASVYLKARAINTFGASEWSAPAAVEAADAEIGRPVLNVFSETASIFDSGSPVLLSSQPVAGATGYEIQVTNFTDPYFNYSVTTHSTASPNATLQYEYSGLFHWRMRAVKDSIKGPWSERAYFSVNPRLGAQFLIPLPEKLDALPTGFPFVYQTTTFYSKAIITISAKSDFTNPLYQKEFFTPGNVTAAVSGLPAQTPLFVRVEEWNLEKQYFPVRKIADYTFTIKTGSDAPAANLTFISGVEANVFNITRPKIAVAEKSVWLESPAFGFVRLDKKSLAFQIYNRENTNGLIGNSYMSKPLVADSAGRINVLSWGIIDNLRRAALPSDAPDSSAVVKTFLFKGDIEGFSPTHGLYWNRRGVYREFYGLLNPVLLADEAYQFWQVAVAGNRIWILQLDYRGGGEVIVLDIASGKELQRFSSASHPHLLYYIDQIAVNNEGQLVVRQFDPVTATYFVAVWDNEKWSVFTQQDNAFSGNVQACAASPKGKLYMLTDRNGHGIYQYEDGKWKEVADIQLEGIAQDLVPDDQDNIWLTGQYGLVRVSTAELITGTDEPALPVINIYPNPSSDRIVVHFEQQGAQASDYFISDIRGRQVASLQTTSNLAEWDIRQLGAGTYILWTIQKGQKRSWKIVKN